MSERDRLGPPPVEPLSEIAWHRVEKSLFATLDCDASAPVVRAAAPTWWRWAAGGGLALAAAAALVAIVVTRDDGAATARDGGAATWRPDAPSRVATLDAPTEVQFGDAHITVEANSALTLHGDADAGVLILLERGAATFEVAPRAGRPPFVLQAGEVSVRVVGTRFTVSRSGDAASVDVTEGHVEVVAQGHRVQVHAGESWSSGGDREAAAGGLVAPPGGIAAALLSDESDDDEGGDVTQAESVQGAPGDAGGTAVTAPRPRPRASRDDKASFERAAALEASDPRAALAAYRDLARGRGAWAANALYAAGRLAAELDDRKTATRLLGDYLRRYPTGANAADARALLRTLEPR